MIWGFGIKFKELEMIYIRMVRLIYKLLKCMKDDDILVRVGWMFFEYFYKFCIVIIIYVVFYWFVLNEVNFLVVVCFYS